MNQQIKELVKNLPASIYVSKDGLHNLAHPLIQQATVVSGEMADLYEYTIPVYCRTDLEEFAKLIIQECIQQINSLMDYTEYDDAEKQAIELKALRDARQVINEHFGISNEPKH